MSDPAGTPDGLIEPRALALRNMTRGDALHNLGFETAAQAWAMVDSIDVQAVDDAALEDADA